MTQHTHTETKTATLVKPSIANMRGNARLYELSEPLNGHSHVVVSAVVAYSGPETYIFGADPAGEVVNWPELPGSFQGGMDHTEALNGAGYKVAS